MRTAILILLIFVSSQANAQNRTGEGEVRELYENNCSVCHGMDLAGGSGSSLIDDQWIHGSGNEAIAAAIRNGIPDTEMQAWAGTLRK